MPHDSDCLHHDSRFTILSARHLVTRRDRTGHPLVQPAADVAATVQVPRTCAAQPPAPAPTGRGNGDRMIALLEMRSGVSECGCGWMQVSGAAFTMAPSSFTPNAAAIN